MIKKLKEYANEPHLDTRIEMCRKDLGEWMDKHTVYYPMGDDRESILNPPLPGLAPIGVVLFWGLVIYFVRSLF